MKRLLLVLTVVATTALAAAPAAQALIQVDRSISGVAVGNTKQQVRAALGTPRRVINGTNDFGSFTEFRYTGKIRVIFQSGNRVTSVETTGRGDRTARNVGVGSTLRAVRNRVAGIQRCLRIPGGRLCETGSGRPGALITAFFIRSGRVTRIVVGRVID